MPTEVLVIGGGAAGVMAACTAAQNGHRVTLIEKNERIGRKVLISGKGRCNVTNATDTVEELLDHIPGNARFLYSAFHGWMPADTMELFESLGVPLKVERGNRVFPVSDKSVDIVDAMDRWLKQSGVRRLHDTALHIAAENNTVTGVVTKRHGTVPADAVILATGGLSYPRTGSTGDGYQMAKELGHTVTELIPSLVPMTSEDKSCAEMQGLSLRNVNVSVVDTATQKKVFSDFGEMLFTHFGVSGPLVLSASSHLRSMEPGRYELRVDLKPALSDEQLEARLLRDFEAASNKDFRNALGDLLPRSMIPVFVRKTGVDPFRKVNQITREERRQILQTLRCFTIPLSGFRPIEEAIVTSGGVNVKEVDPKTMMSKLVDGLYIAGEVLDVDAYTGGFNLQIAFSTGRLAGLSIKQGES